MTEKDTIVSESYVDSFFGGADTIIAAPEKKEDEEKKVPETSVFKKEEVETPLNQLFGNEEESIIKDDDNIIESKGPAKKEETPKKEEFASAISELIKEGIIFGFEEGEANSIEDIKELIKANKEEWKKEVISEELDAVFESLPEDLQYAVEYVKSGGRDLKSLFKILSQTQEVKSMEVGKSSKDIAKTYLEYTKYGTAEEIAEQVGEWEDLELLDKKAELFKPKLEKLHEQMVQDELKKQEEVKVYQKQLIKQYFDGVSVALQDKNLNGLVINKEEQASLYTDLTENNYTSSRTGQPINFLGKFFETITWDKPDYKMLAELTLFAKNPEKYKEKIMNMGKLASDESTVRKLKTAQGGLKATTTQDDEPKSFTVPKRTITRNSILKK